MLPSEKEVIATLLQACEFLYVQNILLRGLVRKAGVGDWRRKLDNEANSVVANLAREVFQKQYAQAVQSHEAMREFLVKLPTSDSVQ